MGQPVRSHKLYCHEKDNIIPFDDTLTRGYMDNDISNKACKLFRVKDEELLRHWQTMIDINNSKSHQFIEHIEKLSKIIKTLNKNIRFVDMETKKMKRNFELYERKQQKYLNSNVTFENELRFLQSSVSAKFFKQKNIIYRLKRQNGHLLRLLKENVAKNEEIHRFNEDKLLNERKGQKNLLDDKTNSFYEETIWTLKRQFEKEKDEIYQSHKNEIEKIKNDNNTKSQELIQLTNDKEKLNVQYSNILIQLRETAQAFSEGRYGLNQSNDNDIRQRLSILEKENSELLKKNQLQDLSVAELIGQIRELQFNSIDPNSFLVEGSDTILNNDCQLRIHNEDDEWSTYNQKMFFDIDTVLRRIPKSDCNLPPLYRREESNETGAFTLDLEKQISKLKHATYQCINSIKYNLN